jgi:hypothetical protein
MAAAATGKTRACRWEDEVDDLAAEGPRLSSSARFAVCAVLDSLITEGALNGREVQKAMALRDALDTRRSAPVAISPVSTGAGAQAQVATGAHVRP